MNFFEKSNEKFERKKERKMMQEEEKERRRRRRSLHSFVCDFN